MTAADRAARNALRRMKRDLESPSSPFIGMINTDMAEEAIRAVIQERAPEFVEIGGVPCKLSGVEFTACMGRVQVNLSYDPVNLFDRVRPGNLFDDLGEIDEPTWMPEEDAWVGYARS